MFKRHKKLPSEQTILSPYDYARITENIVSEQLDFFKDVLLVSLRIIQSGLRDKQEDSFDDVFEAVLKGIKRVFQYLEPRKNTIVRGEMNALLAFTFYRIAYQQTAFMLPATPENKCKLLQRIPAKLALYLGDQDWRLYEFYSVVYGDFSTFTINADIGNVLETFCAGCVPAAPVATNAAPTAHAQTHGAIPLQVGVPTQHAASPVKQGQSTTPAPTPQVTAKPLAKQSPSPTPVQPSAQSTAMNNSQRAATPKKAAAPVSIAAPEKTSENPPATKPLDLGEKLRKWALKNSGKGNARFAINTGCYFFAAPIAFGEKRVFVSEAGVAHFLRSHTGTKDALLASPIIEQGFCLAHDNTPLIAVQLDAPLTHFQGTAEIKKAEAL